MWVHSFPDTTLIVKLMPSPLNKVASIGGYCVLINVKCTRVRAPTCKHVQVNIHYVQMSYMGLPLKIMSLSRTWHMRNQVEKSH